ncbi:MULTISPECIES: DTW domain-containing protein [unclassified Pseudomonas]|uniref:tRNA-uridine aminocarboxypropyltransferase n=1 Tax=unclassified Pseudomonas TaxID=196821 RepID=UPI000A0B7F74|nr:MULTISPECIES: DTW domain-containing protein [unclassified Pseudomonas]SMF01840.1 DTW domain-containing protein YfiP [Pseudomonas sp. LAIL14HWK12:I11]SMR72347.1 DTW domain-containing protein YfiP [Pseudomonas sp. LAIL14HWK12:I10]SOD01266.1 DTW domain-containing protein YfiP [Pseudomonas sp. LAIL14HWK12:I8]
MPRPRCERCQRPLDHCLCPLIPSLDSRTRVVLLQHPSESAHALNTARLAALGLVNAELRVGEVFDDLVELLQTPGYRPALLFPGEHAQVLTAYGEGDDRPLLLIVPDGTWRKARKLLYLNPLLEALPRVTLGAVAPSRYRLRKAPEPGALSTLEAVVEALNVLEQPVSFDALLKPFEALIEGQIKAMGAETFQRNHGTP